MEMQKFIAIVITIIRISPAFPSLWTAYKWITGATDNIMAVTLGPAEYFALTGSGIMVLCVLCWQPLHEFCNKIKEKRPEEKFKKLNPPLVEICMVIDLNDLSKEDLWRFAKLANQLGAQLDVLGITDPRRFSKSGLMFPDDVRSQHEKYIDLRDYSAVGAIKIARCLGRLVRARPV